MDFSIFEDRANLPVLTWLGKKDWTIYKDIPERRAVSAKPRQFVFVPKQGDPVPEGAIVVPRKEMEQFPDDHWKIVKSLLGALDYDVVATFWYDTLSKSLAGGPKLFRPTVEQCVALENTAATFPFDMYRQPYPVIILEIPEGYRAYLQEKYKVATKDTPSHVLVHHNDKHNYIAVNAFVSMDNIITHLTPMRAEYETIEDSITKNRNRRKEHLAGVKNGDLTLPPVSEAEFDAAENVQRLAINFAMMMTLLGVKNTGVVNPTEYRRWQQEAHAVRRGGIPTHRAVEAKANLTAAMYLLQFEQKIDFYDEIEEAVEVSDAVELDRLHKSPRTHWRKGHWAKQPYGPERKLRKAIFRKPIMVRFKYFIGESKDTSVIYTAHPKRD